jgi:hypothetical protein
MGGIVVGLRGSDRLKGGAPPLIGSGSSAAAAAEYLFVGLSYFCVFGRDTNNGMTSFSILVEERGFRSLSLQSSEKNQICSFVHMSTDLKSVVFSRQNKKKSADEQTSRQQIYLEEP